MSLKRKKSATKTQRLSRAWLYMLGFLGNPYGLCNLKTAYLHETGNNSKTASWWTLATCFPSKEAQFPVICGEGSHKQVEFMIWVDGDEEKPTSGTGILDSQHLPWKSSSRQRPGPAFCCSLWRSLESWEQELRMQRGSYVTSTVWSTGTALPHLQVQSSKNSAGVTSFSSKLN